MSKKQLGQFYTTNYEYILKNMQIPDNITTIIEPFVGCGDLLSFIKNKQQYHIEIYDIDPKYENTIKQDTLKNPPQYKDKFVLTNPPYLARNKSKNKEIYDKYDCNDLYKCFISILIENICSGGIIIIPLNFISSIRKSDITLREKFLKIYSIHTINIFEESVFKDTSYSVCSLYFTKKTSTVDDDINVFIYPSNTKMKITLNCENNFTIGGEILKKYYKDNPEARQKQSEGGKKYYKDNPEAGQKHGEIMKKYYKDNPEARRKLSDGKGKNKPFDVFEKDGTYIKSFDYQFEAMEYLQTTYKIKTRIKICDVLKGNRNNSHGFIFKYKE